MTTNIPVLIDLSETYSRIGSFRTMNPFVTIFLYCKNIENSRFIVGGKNNITPHLLKYLETCGPCIEHRVYHRHKMKRTFYRFHNFSKRCEPHIIDNSFNTKRIHTIKRRYSLYSQRKSVFDYADINTNLIRHMRRIPKMWIKELDPYVDEKITLTVDSSTQQVVDAINNRFRYASRCGDPLFIKHHEGLIISQSGQDDIVIVDSNQFIEQLFNR